MYNVYFIESQKNYQVYVGYTSKTPEERLNEHNQGSNQFSKTYKPFKLIYFETYHCKTDAIKRENFYKSGFGKRIKKAIIKEIKES
ncbi:MAG: GIY-YIG nuclease family protein [Candidatus Beckwithbacteria bacterium]